MLIHGVTYSRAMYVTKDAAIDRLNTLCRGSALYPHHRTHVLALLFRWTNGVPIKLTFCHDTLGYSDEPPLWVQTRVAPCLPDASTATVVAKQKRSQTGTSQLQQLWALKVMSAYLIRVTHAHNLP